jgi:hypothetical protein
VPSSDIRRLILAVVLVTLALLIAAALSRVGSAQPKSARAELAELLARTSAHEGALKNERDLDLVWQVVEGSGATTEKRLEFLRLHSPQVAGRRPCRENCWALEINGKTLPANVAAGDVAYWTKIVMPIYRTLAARATKLVRGMPYDRPCEGNPSTWGGKMDRERALKEGLVLLHCEGTLNDGYAWP